MSIDPSTRVRGKPAVGIKLKSQLGATRRLPFDPAINAVLFDEVNEQHWTGTSRLPMRWVPLADEGKSTWTGEQNPDEEISRQSYLRRTNSNGFKVH